MRSRQQSGTFGITISLEDSDLYLPIHQIKPAALNNPNAPHILLRHCYIQPVNFQNNFTVITADEVIPASLWRARYGLIQSPGKKKKKLRRRLQM